MGSNCSKFRTRKHIDKNHHSYGKNANLEKYLELRKFSQHIYVLVFSFWLHSKI